VDEHPVCAVRQVESVNLVHNLLDSFFRDHRSKRPLQGRACETQQLKKEGSQQRHGDETLLAGVSHRGGRMRRPVNPLPSSSFLSSEATFRFGCQRAPVPAAAPRRTDAALSPSDQRKHPVKTA
jgi:hypothetical protein